MYSVQGDATHHIGKHMENIAVDIVAKTIRKAQGTPAFQLIKDKLESYGIVLSTVVDLSKEVYDAYEAGLDDSKARPDQK